jgi:hypothetical protein
MVYLMKLHSLTVFDRNIITISEVSRPRNDGSNPLFNLTQRGGYGDWVPLE